MTKIDYSSYTEDQKEAMSLIKKWYKSPKQEFKLGGLAGTGKSTLIGNLPKFIPGVRVAYCAFTGKAVRVLESKGIPATTIHKLIYDAKVEYDEETETMACDYRWKNISDDYDIIVVDEASTVSRELYFDLKRQGIKMMFVGDYGQLPPVGTEFNLVDEKYLDFKLQKIHRQAENSGIIRLAMAVRSGYNIAFHDGKDTRKCKYSDLTGEEFLAFDQIITGKNITRVAMNSRYRELMKIEGQSPVVKDKIILLRNDFQKGIYNGQQGIITSIGRGKRGNYKTSFIDIDSRSREEIRTLLYPSAFNNPINVSQMRIDRNHYYYGLQMADYAYCISVHKSQGSEWKNVLFVDDHMMSFDFEFRKRLLYTAVTRASEKITIADL